MRKAHSQQTTDCYPLAPPTPPNERAVPTELVTEGRVHGGGLHKVEPKELAQIPARLVLESMDTHMHIEQQERLFA